MKEFREISYSTSEIVLECEAALRYLDKCKELEIKVLGWEGWIVRESGTLGHSRRHQGTVDLSNMTILNSIEYSKESIVVSQAEWNSNPEYENAKLLFCLSTDT